MRQTNGYVLTFTVILTVVCAGLLAGVNSALKDTIKDSKDNDKKTQILSAKAALPEGCDIAEAFEQNIIGMIVDHKGNVVSTNTDEAFKVNVKKEFSNLSTPEKMKLPVFGYKSLVDTSKMAVYIIPVYGNGLWDKVWGFIAVDGEDLNTIKGAVFDHLAETPGLGARITEKDGEVDNAFPTRFVDKKIYDENMNFKSITVMKGEKNDPDDITAHLVDGLSGASMTTGGVNTMLKKYLKLYDPFFSAKRKEVSLSSSNGSKVDIRNLKK